MSEHEFMESIRKPDRLKHNSEKRFRQLFESMNEGSALHRIIYNDRGEPVDYTVLDVNPAYEIILGLKRNEVVDRKASEIYGSKEPPYLDIFAAVASSGKPYSFETYFTPMQKYFNISVCSPEKDYFDTVFSDATERKQAEEKLKKSETLYRSLFDHMLNGFAYCRMLNDKNQPLDFIYLAVNAAFERLTGLKNVEGKRVSEVIPGIQTADPGLLEIYNRVASSGKAEQFELFLESLQMWFAVSVYCPQTGYFVAVFDVITERKRAEQALKEIEAFNSSLLENAPNPILVYDLDYSIRYVNPAFETLTGFLKTELVGRKQPYPWWPEDKYNDYENENSRMKTGEIMALDRYILKKNREPLWVAIRIQKVDNQGQVKYYLSNWLDVTGHKLSEDALQEEVNSKALFIDVLAHELRGPLSPILSSSEILKDLLESRADEKLKKLSINVGSSAKILSSRLDELLEQARYSRGAFTLNTAQVDIKTFVEGVASRYIPSLEQSGHKLAVNIHGKLPCIELDPSRMEQVLVNLLSNAAKYSPANSKIDLSVRLDSSQLLIDVKDEGKGLSEADQKQLFQPYHRLERDKKNSPGLGLGLSICKQIVEAHGGKIQVFSKLGLGSTFRIIIPIK
jgi:PAS domain S-box-containing protein